MPTLNNSNTTHNKDTFVLVAKRARNIFLILITLLFFTSLLPVYYGIKNGRYSKALSNFSEKIDKTFNAFTTVKSGDQVNYGVNINIVGDEKTTIQNKVITPTPNPTVTPKTTVSKATTKPCYRYKVTHLDNSTSYLCYSAGDHDTLVDLGYDLSSAKSFYKFHMDTAERYQDEYERSGSSIYLDAKASAETSAKREQEKINQITLQMQNIEVRGY